MGVYRMMQRLFTARTNQADTPVYDNGNLYQKVKETREAMLKEHGLTEKDVALDNYQSVWQLKENHNPLGGASLVLIKMVDSRTIIPHVSYTSAVTDLKPSGQEAKTKVTSKSPKAAPITTNKEEP